MKSSLELQRHFASEHEVDFQLEPGELQISVDPVLVQQVVTNLVTNAISHAPTGGNVAVKLLEEEHRGGLNRESAV